MYLDRPLYECWQMRLKEAHHEIEGALAHARQWHREIIIVGAPLKLALGEKWRRIDFLFRQRVKAQYNHNRRYIRISFDALDRGRFDSPKKRNRGVNASRASRASLVGGIAAQNSACRAGASFAVWRPSKSKWRHPNLAALGCLWRRRQIGVTVFLRR